MQTPEQHAEFKAAYDSYVDARSRYEKELLAIFRREKELSEETVHRLAAETVAAHKRFGKAAAPFTGGREIPG
ncbi:hypothetical protein FAZ95_13990 [Trinickia violacea]|uniref:Uncharacterized protein n=1 Tax=Trinickia violacea TaxID=2571746 RepID=A0A4P8ISH0_9BURK|nr:hypothetical protein [Trinickia violacea]QCP50193.1 hypothetical protein FAZ95_13990 [Trinickia violacea]